MNYELIRTIPIEDGFDLVVAGGGPAGCASAISAARLGLKVLLVEATGSLGGMGASGQVCAFNPMADGEKMLVGGIGREIVETLYERGFMCPGIHPDSWRKDYMSWSSFQMEGLKLILDEMVINAGVKVRFFSKVIDAQVDQGNVEGVIIHNIEGYAYIKAARFIDATGDAVLSALCGVKYREAGVDTPYIMPATLTALFAGVDWEQPSLQSQTPECVDLIEKEYDLGNFDQCDRHFVGLWKNGEDTGYLNGGHIFGLKATDIESLTDGMIKGRKLLQQYSAFLRKYSKNCQNLELVSSAPLMGVRESRRIVGEYELTIDDYLARRQFPDQIGVFSNFIDVHPYDCSKEEYERFLNDKENRINLSKGECFGIPYGILIPKGFKNLWTAGRCVSCDVLVQGSIRVMPACFLMGQAAGTAAALSINSDTAATDVNIPLLTKTLRDNGAYLP